MFIVAVLCSRSQKPGENLKRTVIYRDKGDKGDRSKCRRKQVPQSRTTNERFLVFPIPFIPFIPVQ
jgi:hypothetical protein